MVKSVNRTLTIGDVLVGEVWITPGQKNMEHPLIHTNEADIDILAADYPQIRPFMPARRAGRGTDGFSSTPLDDFMDEIDTPNSEGLPRNRWISCSPEIAGRLSAVPFYFARTLHWNLKVPIGIVNPSLGGTHAHTWMQSKTVRSTPGADGLVEEIKTKIKNYESGEAYRRTLVNWEKRVAEAKEKGKTPPPRPVSGYPRAELPPARYYNAIVGTVCAIF